MTWQLNDKLTVQINNWTIDFIVSTIELGIRYETEVFDEEGTSPSLYPYTDFYRKKYIYNHENKRFEPNPDSLNPTPDIWHGVIVPPSKNEAERIQELKDFFTKNSLYSSAEPNEYNTFNQRLLYYNFPAVEKKLNPLDYNNYKRQIRYLEEVVY